MKIKILTDFSYTPGPRYFVEGKHSGEEFRDTVLRDSVRKAIRDDEILTVDLDGTAGYGRSFIEEAFGGLIRVDKIKYDDIVAHLQIVSEEEPEWEPKIKEYLKKANEEAQMAEKE